MTRRKVSGTCLPNRQRCLGNLCGTSIDTEGIDFTAPKSNLVYMDKVFSYNDDTSCPLLFNLNTGGNNANFFKTEFTTSHGDCCCSPCKIGRNAVFNVDRSYVLVEYFNTRAPGNINASQVTVDGIPVDCVSYQNGQYVAKTANLLPKIEKDRCLDAGLPTKTFFLINNAGPWDFRARFILEGTVNTDGQCCKFCLEIKPGANAPNMALPNAGLSNFAIPDLSIPCSINGIAPDILFQFGANIKMVNPKLVVNCGTVRPDRDDCGCGCGSRTPSMCLADDCTVSLCTTLAIEPTVHTEVVRKTLFCVTACESLQPCDGSLEALEEEECTCADLTKPDCTCGTSSGISPITDCACAAILPDNTCNTSCGCNNHILPDYGCDDSCCDNTCGCNCGCDNTCGCNSCGCDNTCGCNSCGSNSCGCDTSCGCDNSCNNHQHNCCIQPRTAFQYNGCNGCSW